VGDLAGKTFLQGQALVLIGSGADLRALTGRCLTLRQSGQFKSVHVLLGGVRSWRLAGQPIQAGGSALLPPGEASAQDLWLGAADGLWRIAALGLSARQRQSLPVPTDQVLDLGAPAAQAVQELERQINRQPLPAPASWLVVAADAQQLAQAQALWQQRQNTQDAHGQHTIVWLAGGWPAYASYLEQQKTLAAHAGRSLPRICGM